MGANARCYSTCADCVYAQRVDNGVIPETHTTCHQRYLSLTWTRRNLLAMPCSEATEEEAESRSYGNVCRHTHCQREYSDNSCAADVLKALQTEPRLTNETI